MQTNKEVPQPLLSYFGGKWQLAPWILSFMPTHRIYIEPFGGGGSVLLRKPRSHVEVYNDLDGEVVNIFRVLRDYPNELVRVIDLTPYSRDEYALACEPMRSDTVIEKARKAIVRSFFGFGSTGLFDGPRPGFRTCDGVRYTTFANTWAKYADSLLAIIERMKGVTIENKDALDLISSWDLPETVFYVDPPYLPSIRRLKQVYTYEMTEDQHKDLLNRLCALKGTVMVSGYASELYDSLLSGWERHTRKVMADGGRSSRADRERTEVLWIKKPL